VKAKNTDLSACIKIEQMKLRAETKVTGKRREILQ
jgi:hypothetical protein